MSAEPVRDPGLQPERTRLAWRRTTLAGTVAAVLAGRAALHAGVSAPRIVVCALCGLLWLGFLAIANRRIHTLAASPEPRALAPRHATAAVLCTVGLAVCGAVLVL
ncbi:DUF202 domain-containing protein [Streptomyces cinnabarinus]|uniref:DUF202 domain-containing protein n=1 Tax=Streptomyces cinnabarinus TaxID=67287 RepID=A0ABY7K8D2_9ACTN|nr:DUF202 domain-containing protein [Streptomyces cinnabarinus]WAZ20634.1 DUF202 domain-containing protein [Streptomyces cinnabarinus]